MMYVDEFKRERLRIYLSQGFSKKEADNKLMHWLLNHKRKIKKITDRNGFKVTFIKSIPHIDSGCEHWYVDIDYNNCSCYLYHKNRDDDEFHRQKVFNQGTCVTDNFIDICSYIWGHSNKHIQRDFNNTLRNKLHECHINEREV